MSSEIAAMARQNPNPYLVLGVSPTATQAEITHAYRTRLRAHHPDTRHTPPSQTADDDLRQVLAAYDLLRDPARRADYDRATTLATAPQTPLHPIPQCHHCGPARCAGTDSCAIREHLGAQP